MQSKRFDVLKENLLIKHGIGLEIKNTPISVDFFAKKGYSHLNYRFLTHAHTDHTKLLNERWNTGKILCSEVTKKFLIMDKKVPEEFIEVLLFNQTYTFEYIDNEKKKQKFNVVLIDANHCPGSAMVLLSGVFGTVLATGDFRYIKDMFSKYSPLSNLQVDVCHLDNFNNNPLYSTLPSRIKATKIIFDLIERFYSNEKKIFELEIASPMSKCDLLIEISEYLNEKIAVSEKRHEFYAAAYEQVEKYFTTKSDDKHRFYVTDQNKTLKSYFINQKLDWKNVIKIVPSSLRLNRKKTRNLFEVSYSDHSTLNDLDQFISYLKPACIVPQLSERKETDEIIKIDDCSRFGKYLRNPIVRTQVFECIQCNIEWDYDQKRGNKHLCPQCETKGIISSIDGAKRRLFICSECQDHWYSCKKETFCCRIKCMPVPEKEEYALVEFKCPCGHFFSDVESIKMKLKCNQCRSFTMSAKIIEKPKVIQKVSSAGKYIELKSQKKI